MVKGCQIKGVVDLGPGCKPRRKARCQSYFYLCKYNEIVSNLSHKLFAEALNERRLRILSKRDILEVITFRIHQLKSSFGINYPKQWTHWRRIPEAKWMLSISKRCVLILWTVRKVPTLPKEWCCCGMGVTMSMFKSVILHQLMWWLRGLEAR